MVAVVVVGGGGGGGGGVVTIDWCIILCVFFVIQQLSFFFKPNKGPLQFFCVFFIQFNGTPFQDYFTHIETSQSVGGVKREYPGKTT